MTRNVTSIVTLVKKVRDCYILHTVLLVIILLLIIIIIIIFNYYAKKKYNIKWETINFKMFILKIVSVIISVT